jgi:predicted glycoside hydrolase/deacetylase ChbG (UPF0249 family)
LRRLIVNADDFGYTADVNDGIIEAHRHGILTAATLMANGRAFDHAVRLAGLSPNLDPGCHLVLIGGESLVSGKPFPNSVAQLVRDLVSGRWDVEREFRAQIERTVAAGIRPTHLDTHKHTHLFPSVLRAVARLSAEFGIRWVRRPFDFPLEGGPVPRTRRWLTAGLGFLRPFFEQTLARHGCQTTDAFAGFALTGAYTVPEFVRLAKHLPPGITEFMTHPGYCREELRAAPTRLKETREAELRVLVDPESRDALRREGVVLTTYRGL